MTRTRRIRPPDPPNVVLIHASATSIDNRGLVFTGRSGAGKSTICRILDGVGDTLADDKVYLVRQTDGQWHVIDATARAFRGPLSSRELTTLQGPVLRAIFELHKSPETRLDRVNPAATCRYLASAFFDLHYWACYYDTEVKRTAFRNLAIIARSVSGYDLHVSISGQTPDVIMDGLGFQSSFMEQPDQKLG